MQSVQDGIRAMEFDRAGAAVGQAMGHARDHVLGIGHVGDHVARIYGIRRPSFGDDIARDGEAEEFGERGNSLLARDRGNVLRGIDAEDGIAPSRKRCRKVPSLLATSRTKRWPGRHRAARRSQKTAL